MCKIPLGLRYSSKDLVKIWSKNLPGLSGGMTIKE